jgi:hypothetical protein
MEGNTKSHPRMAFETKTVGMIRSGPAEQSRVLPQLQRRLQQALRQLPRAFCMADDEMMTIPTERWHELLLKVAILTLPLLLHHPLYYHRSITITQRK